VEKRVIEVEGADLVTYPPNPPLVGYKKRLHRELIVSPAKADQGVRPLGASGSSGEKLRLVGLSDARSRGVG
jgi:hypothetical protein